MMASFAVKKGAELRLQWPQIQNIVSIDTTEEVFEKLKSNQLCSVTEKLDGCNLSVSSSGWISSRRQILVENVELTDLSKVKFNGQKLTNLKDIWLKVVESQAELQACLSTVNFELIIYGEFIIEGTATTRDERFSYKPREIDPEQLYAFGLGFHFEKGLESEERKQFEEKIKGRFNWNLFQVNEASSLFIFNYNSGLNKYFKERLFKVVPYVGDDLLTYVLSNQPLAEKLKNREVEGFVLTGSNFILKWKFFEKGQKSSQKTAIEALKAKLTDLALVDAVRTMEDVILSEPPEGKEFKPIRKPSKKLFCRFLGSAASKLPSPLDSFKETTSLEDLLETCESYRAALEAEITKDFVEAGFKLDSDDHREMLAKLENFKKGLVSKLLAKRQKKLSTTDWEEIV